MRDSEARQWVKMYQSKLAQVGKTEAFEWWKKTVEDLEKKRGRKSVDELRARMNEQRNMK
jgi:hypothetical protein